MYMQKFHVSIPYVSVCLTWRRRDADEISFTRHAAVVCRLLAQLPHGFGRSGERSCNTSIEQTIRLRYRHIEGLGS